MLLIPKISPSVVVLSAQYKLCTDVDVDLEMNITMLKDAILSITYYLVLIIE